jgi:hypothetical protein
MAHFAEIDSNNIVKRVLVVSDSQQHRGQDFLANDLKLGGTWIQTSYNTRGGVHINNGTPLRKNYAGVGHTYDAIKDAFIAPKPFNSWILNEDTCIWNAPAARPADKNSYIWNEPTLSWVKQDISSLPE